MLGHLLAGVLGAALFSVLAGPWVRSAEAAYTPIPSGAILYRDATTCWAGWTIVTAARGAYIVGLVSGGTLHTLVGTALTDQENRPAGKHNHNITDAGHTHNGRQSSAPTAGFSAPLGGYIAANTGNTSGGDNFTTSGVTGVTVDAGGGGTSGQAGTTGTNAPYLQYLVCKKN